MKMSGSVKERKKISGKWVNEEGNITVIVLLQQFIAV